ncbi:sulfite exporter TauE/SafE family protein [Marivivens sp. LCG002]|uniref:sulfite exporter TauE/SafE family protein n=1 Tax=Marivivens sp. LCG002 TaxID=3051171 RepID=UPI002554FA94|nr:sulfite exporter TauE/SafE family protein [Marivivens sp. LCG002]WIV50235.1 sulfite exporter TauE/SafE family protein [Marivivens sp. LCG002]
MEGTTFWVLATVAAICVGVSKGGWPVVGMLSVPLLSLVISPVVAAGLLLPVYVVSDMFGLYAYRHEFNKRVVLIIAASATVGVAIGGLTAHIVPEAFVTLIVGIVGFLFALYMIVRDTLTGEEREGKLSSGIFWGVLTGFTSFVSHAGAPPYQIWVLPQRLSKIVFAGTSTITFAYINAIKLIPYYMLGQINLASIKIALVLMIPASIAVFVGVKMVKVISDKVFFRVVIGALFVVSVKLIWDGVSTL